jgi:hypothetical protein
MLGSHGALTLSGALAGHSLLLGHEPGSEGARLRAALLYGLGLASAALLLHTLRDLHPMFTYNKIAATPPWCLMSAAWTVWLLAGLQALAPATRDGVGPGAYVAAAGRNALFAFILGPILYALIELGPLLLGGSDVYSRLGASFSIGLWRSLALAAGATWLTGWLGRRGWGLRL